MKGSTQRRLKRPLQFAFLATSAAFLLLPKCYSGDSDYQLKQQQQHLHQSSSSLRRQTRVRNSHYYWDTNSLEKDVGMEDTEVADAEVASSSSSDSNSGRQNDMNPYWNPSYWNPLTNPYWSTEFWHAQIKDKEIRQAQDNFVSQCLTALEDSSVNNKVDGEQFVMFLRDISQGNMVAREFKDLPLFLTMIFFSAACTSGEDCIAEEPAITTAASPEDESQLNEVLCRQLMRFPFLEVLYPFQFLIRVSEDVTAEELMAESDPTRIIPRLEQALDHVLLEGLNCSNARASRQRQPQQEEDCDYVVDVEIEDAADYPCGFQDSCILIFSDVSIFAVLEDSRDEPQLRSLTTNLLRDAINGDVLESHLPPSLRDRDR